MNLMARESCHTSGILKHCRNEPISAWHKIGRVRHIGSFTCGRSLHRNRTLLCSRRKRTHAKTRSNGGQPAGGIRFGPEDMITPTILQRNAQDATNGSALPDPRMTAPSRPHYGSRYASLHRRTRPMSTSPFAHPDSTQIDITGRREETAPTSELRPDNRSSDRWTGGQTQLVLPNCHIFAIPASSSNSGPSE